MAWRVPPSPPTSPSLHVFRVLKWGDCSWIKQLAAKIAPDIFKSHHWITIDHHHHPSHLNYHLYNENKQTISGKRPKMKKRPVDRGATHASIIFGHCRALDWRLHWSGPENHCKAFSKAFPFSFFEEGVLETEELHTICEHLFDQVHRLGIIPWPKTSCWRPNKVTYKSSKILHSMPLRSCLLCYKTLLQKGHLSFSMSSE